MAKPIIIVFTQHDPAALDYRIQRLGITRSPRAGRYTDAGTGPEARALVVLPSPEARAVDALLEAVDTSKLTRTPKGWSHHEAQPGRA